MIRSALIALFVLCSVLFCCTGNISYEILVNLVSGKTEEGVLERADEQGLKIKSESGSKIVEAATIAKVQILPYKWT
ncbi:hypothetical protein ACFSJU_17070 [Paradesertivirga mongoliensis]|uniref:Uncharacterized protein n=1 Tax=Paradesertivirga mongoliensis TaxID=2100740 RepID=A0ABW4ZPS2_9SPHI|nr:hypothetical protein [Pedobacter mongoliensis]